MAARVLITRPIPEPGASLIERVAEVAMCVREDRSPTRAELIAAIADADILLCLLTETIDAEILAAAPKCKLVANMAVGYNNIDVAEATRRGMIVTNTPGVLTEATADLTWALILASARRVVEGDEEMRAGRFHGWGPFYMLGVDVFGKTLGLVGPGRIAQATARRAVGFRMNLLYHGRKNSPEIEELGAKHVELDELLRESDFVSLHTPLTAETRHLINRRALELMKPTAYLINTARGPVVDEKALVEALKNGTIARAGLDVYEDEPRIAEGLAACPNATLLPHLGSATAETRSAMARIAAENIVAFVNGSRPSNTVNPEVYANIT